MQKNSEYLLSSAYFAPLQYYSKLIGGSVKIEMHENFTKQSYRNRCTIYGANGPLTLSIPVKRNHGDKTIITDIRLDYDTNWQLLHKRGIISAYGSSPFFEYYIDDVISFFEKKYKYLVELNMQILETTCELLEIEPNISVTNDYEISPVNMLDFRNSIHPKRRMQKPDINYKTKEYNQVFIEKNGFIPNLSILDLLFNEGPNSYNTLHDSTLPA